MTEIKIIKPGEDIKDCKQVRYTVFCKEQGYSEAEEYDELDSSVTHLIMYDDKKPIATGRIINGGNGQFILGRIAVLKEYRGKNLGLLIVNEMIRIAKGMGAESFKINAQYYAKGFYEKLGFKAYGDTFYEGHVIHIAMKM